MFKPAPGLVFVKEVEVKKGMIVIPDTAQSTEPKVGEVVSVADYFMEQNVKLDMFVKIGDKVVYHPARTINFEIEGEKFVSVYATQILAYEAKK